MSAKITEEELIEKLREGKSISEIARENGYGTGGVNTLSKRIQRLGINIRNKLSVANQHNGRLVSITSDEIKAAGFDPDNGDLYYTREAKEGKIIIHLHEDRVNVPDDTDPTEEADDS